MPHTVIAGASAAGVSAAIAMRKHGNDGHITIVDRDPNRPYERPPLSKSSGRVLRPLVPWSTFSDLDIDVRLGMDVRVADASSRTIVIGDNWSHQVDSLLLCTGVAARRLTVPGADLGHVLVLRDAADAVVLADRLDAGGSLVIVGAGFIGLEVAALARSQGVDVTVVETGAHPLQGMGEQIGRLAADLHGSHGVRFIFGRTVRRLVGSGVVETVVLDDGTLLEASTVVVGVGVTPRTELAHAAGATTDAYGVVVDAYGRTDVPWVFAAGDVASQPHPHLGAARGRIEHWDVAMKHGAAVGATIAGEPTVLDEAPYVWSDQFGLTFQMFGRPAPGDEFVMRHGSTSTSYFGFWVRHGVLVAVCGLDRPRDVGAARRILQLPLGVHQEALADDQRDLKSLVRDIARGTPPRPEHVGGRRTS